MVVPARRGRRRRWRAKKVSAREEENGKKKKRATRHSEIRFISNPPTLSPLGARVASQLFPSCVV